MSTKIPSLSSKDARALSRQIIKDAAPDTRVVPGRTNGRIVLHVQSGRQSRTIASFADWAVCPLNARMQRNNREAQAQETEALMAANGS